MSLLTFAFSGRTRTVAAVGWLLMWSSAAAALDPHPLEFRLRYTPAVSAGPFTGRVYVMLSKQETKEPRSGPNWFNPEPFFATDVKDWKPGETVTFGADALAYPVPLTKVAKGTYWGQAVMDVDRGGSSFATSEGNGYSKSVRVEVCSASGGPVELVIDQVYKPRAFAETERVKLIEIDSKLLTAFHGRPTRLRAAVALPKSFVANPDKRYPVIYEIPGFGGTHTGARARQNATDVAGVEMLWVVLDPSCRLGHHVFADSDNNGPCGKAFVEELIPEIEKRFRGIGTPAARFVTGHSSGGWSSLWLQIMYPDFFGGTWSTAPDPVDFRDFQRINIYKDENMFTDADGGRRPLARLGGKPRLLFKGFSDMEAVMGRGGQLGAFEAVFSPRGPDGKPRPLWDRKTGRIVPAVAKAWERYDIRLVLERNWKDLGPKLAGKIHVVTGAEDNFYLEGATRGLAESLKSLGSDAAVQVVPGRDHFTLLDRHLRERTAQEMAAQFRKHNPGN